jgi:hypothetical protein
MDKFLMTEAEWDKPERLIRGSRMRRLAAIGLALAATIFAARADIAPPPLQFIDVTAGDLTFLVIARDTARPSHPTAHLVACVDGRPNCALAQAKGLIGRRIVGFDGRDFDPGVAVGSQILAAFRDQSAPATIEVDFEPESAGGPLRIAFARR